MTDPTISEAAWLCLDQLYEAYAKEGEHSKPFGWRGREWFVPRTPLEYPEIKVAVKELKKHGLIETQYGLPIWFSSMIRISLMGMMYHIHPGAEGVENGGK